MISIEDKKVGSEPNNVILEDIKTAFIIIPKCGNRSIKTMIVNGLGYGNVDWPLWGLKYAYLNNIPDDWLKIAVVRNPYARMASLYWDKIAKSSRRRQLQKLGFVGREPFSSYCFKVHSLPPDQDPRMDVHLKSQAYFVTNSDGDLKVDAIVKFENMEQDWAKVSELFRYHTCLEKLPELPHLHKTGKPSLKWLYQRNNYLEALIYQRYYKDFELFDYPAEIDYDRT